ncbi:MAG: ABC transporter ATP-binding protein [Cellvibrionaceae bacterium]
MLKVSNATGGYGKTEIIKNVNIDVKPGEAVALLGRNGVGKSTLMRYIMSTIDDFGGSVSIDNADLPKSTSHRARAGLGYVPQGRFVFPRLSVTENIVAAAAACGHDTKEAVDKVFNEFPAMAERPHQLAGSLSGGQQQQLVIGRALATKPRFLLLDEPTEGIQPNIVDFIAEMLAHLNKEYGLAILVAEQNLDFCLTMSQRAYVMDKGTIVKEVTAEELKNDKELISELLGV